MFFQMNSPSVPAALLQPSEARGRYHGINSLVVRAGTALRRVCLIFGASASPFPQHFVSVRESMSYSSLDLLINTQVLDEAKQMAVSSCSGVCIRCCLTGSISGEEIFCFDQRFLLQNICSLLERQMTNLVIVK